MIKHVYKGIILFFVFCAAVVFFGSGLGSSLVNEGKKVKLGKESYPILSVSTEGVSINTLYGYSGSISPSIVRQSITPIGNEKKISISMQESMQKVQKFRYQVFSSETEELLEDETLNAIPDASKTVELPFSYGFESSKEYTLCLTATLESGQLVHYYTKLKYYMDDTHLKGKLDFAMTFHTNTFDKNMTRELANYLETSSATPSNDLSEVNIKSSVDLVTWAQLRPEVTSKIVPIVKEYNTETACVLLNYYIKGTTSQGQERYHVHEFYRVRFAGGRYYLLGFHRTMESVYNTGMVSLNKSQLKLGITSKTDVDILTSKDNKQIYFSRDGILYQYDLASNKMNEIFSSFSNDASDSYRINDEQDIRLNRLDSEGNLYFTMYGYIPRGEYEGKVAVVLYKYIKATNSVEELVYLPQDTTYQQLKEDFETYSYVNGKGIYFFTVSNVVYSYNILGRRLEKVVENATADNFVVLKNKNCFVWSSDMKTGYGDQLTIYNLETDSKTQVSAPDGDSYIRLLGAIDSNVVYGFVRKSDITKTTDGTPVVPCYKMEIVDNDGKELKTYEQKGQYITNVKVEGNVLTMDRCKKSGSGYKKMKEDSILNRESKEEASVELVSRITTATLAEWYMTLPYGFVLTKAPVKKPAPDSVVSNGRAVHLDSPKITKYYVYAFGMITGSYENPAKAIMKADEQMGVVISSKHQLVWERGGSFLMNTISGIEKIQVGDGINNIGACAYIVLKSNHVSADAKELSASQKSIYDMLEKHLERPVNLSGATLDQVIYFVSNGKPVIGMTSSDTAVVITAYTQNSVTYYNPSDGQTSTVSRKQAEDLFKQAGNAFVSYMSDEKGTK